MINSDSLHMIASQYNYAIPVAGALTVIFLLFQRLAYNRDDEKRKVFDITFILKNALFAGSLVGLVMYFGKNSHLEDSIVVKPAGNFY